jgi:hypothetical protein
MTSALPGNQAGARDYRGRGRSPQVDNVPYLFYRTVLELSPVTMALMATDLISVLLVAACSCIIQLINGACVSRAEAGLGLARGWHCDHRTMDLEPY